MPSRYDHFALYNKVPVQVNTDINGDEPQRQARELLIPQIRQKTKNALNVTPAPYEYFLKIRSGRRCSCFTVESDPQGFCSVCYGTGIVGGWQKFGTRLTVLDVTSPQVRCVNVVPDFSRPTRPIMWSLLPSAVFGYLETEISLGQNIGVLDVFHPVCRIPENTSIKIFIRGPVDPDWVEVNQTTLTARLNERSLGLRVEFKRSGPDQGLPLLASLRFSVLTTPETTLRADIPRFTETMALEEFGIFESFSSQTFVLDTSLKNCTTEDFLYGVSDGLKWKVIEVKDNRPLQINTSWDLVCRLVQSFEGMDKLPVGKVLPPSQRPPLALWSYYSHGGGDPVLPMPVNAAVPLNQAHDPLKEQRITDAPEADIAATMKIR